MNLFQLVHQFDVKLINQLMSIKNKPQLTKFARIVSITGDAYFYVGFALWLAYTGQYLWLKIMGMAFGIERVFYFGAKYGFRRCRPEQAIDGFDAHIKPADKYSFPSGHTSAAFLMVAMLVLIYGPVMSLLYLWAAFVAFSRMMLGLHFPSDLAVGAVTGVLSVWLANYWMLL